MTSLTTPTAAESPRAFEVVIRSIEERILSGEVRVGDRLLPERDMAAELGVSRAAVREAIRVLEAQGVLTSQVGGGAAAGTHVTAQRSEALGRLLKLQVALAQFPVDDVVVARIALERSSAALAATRRTEADLAAMSDVLAEMDSGEVEIGDFNDLDTQFHVLIAQAGRSSLVSDLTRAVRQSLTAPILHAEHQMSDWEAFHAGLVAQHTAIFEAVQAGDPERAADVIEDHIRNSYSILSIRPVEPGQPRP